MAGSEIPGSGRRGALFLSLHCHHQNDFCIKIGSDESRLTLTHVQLMYVHAPVTSRLFLLLLSFLFFVFSFLSFFFLECFLFLL